MGQGQKEVKVAVEEFDGVAAVAADSDSEPEPVNIAESDAETLPYRATMAAYRPIDKLTLHIP